MITDDKMLKKVERARDQLFRLDEKAWRNWFCGEIWEDTPFNSADRRAIQTVLRVYEIAIASKPELAAKLSQMIDTLRRSEQVALEREERRE